MTSSTAPLVQVTYFAWPGGTSAKWMPRTTPAAETEMLAWARLQRVPTGREQESKRYHSRKARAGRRAATGVNSKAPLDAQRRDLHRRC